MIATLLIYAGLVLVWLPVVQYIAARLAGRPGRAHGIGLKVAGSLLMTAGNALQQDWPWVAAFGAWTVFWLIVWWRRRKRRNVLALMGNKARARIAAMRQAMRERAKPRPVLKPQRSPA
jgi:hypothetical protein